MIYNNGLTTKIALGLGVEEFFLMDSPGNAGLLLGKILNFKFLN